ncbi:poly-beta-1,6-N-acetyl-D-glucosamine biosynthesis protein PgaD [Methylotenera sp.]|uniref:poly-beta-1,6-N-acetyl-D-glucosamine biosynthesis protein PgaD n=1 Tax=Methylotenera sp. TaxID=2051956 RepID=UPI0024872B24|nr:poly-beta-1,6-N-acetyl-D-glucosamine biosynthesis protein PgaD [Methylotenera sp.]MDI1298490.1 poly-beta-1,6-N-acetyl-D-glucosamine biosynthesis protein PgaD [Methylotenera sp.]
MKNSLIIERPELQSMTQRYGWKSVTFAFWMFYVYLWVPLITLVVWWVGVKLFHTNMIELEGYKSLVDKLGVYSAVILIISMILIGWAEINRMRFKNRIRRLDNNELSVAEVAEKYNLDTYHLTLLRQKKSITVHFNEKGGISEFNQY